MTRKKEDNLKPIKKGQLSNEELKRRQSNGGKKSGEARKHKRLLKDTIEMLMKSKPTPQMVKMYANLFGFNPKDLQEIVTGGLFQQAIKGNPKAFELLRDTMGQKPVDTVMSMNTDVDIEKALNDPNLIDKVFNKIKELE